MTEEQKLIQDYKHDFALILISTSQILIDIETNIKLNILTTRTLPFTSGTFSSASGGALIAKTV
jgi:hypothetical protein